MVKRPPCEAVLLTQSESAALRLDASSGVVLGCTSARARCGFSVAAAGDVNGDGIADALVGAPNASASGTAFVLFGRRSNSPWPGMVDLQGLDGTDGFAVVGIDAGDEAGFSVASAGDVNGDNRADIILGARKARGGSGSAFVVFGASTFPAVLNLAGLNGADGVELRGETAGDDCGFLVRVAAQRCEAERIHLRGKRFPTGKDD